MTHICHHTSSWLRWGLTNFLPRLVSNCNPPSVSLPPSFSEVKREWSKKGLVENSWPEVKGKLLRVKSGLPHWTLVI
jgi:hypothetical protein